MKKSYVVTTSLKSTKQTLPDVNKTVMLRFPNLAAMLFFLANVIKIGKCESPTTNWPTQAIKYTKRWKLLDGHYVVLLGR